MDGFTDMAFYTLRKALRLKKQIEEQLRLNTPSPNIKFDIDRAGTDITSLDKIVASSEKEFISKLSDLENLSQILSEIRDSIDKANTKSGVNSILAQIGHIDRQLLMFKEVTKAEAAYTPSLKKKIERKRDHASQVANASQQSHFSRNSEPDLTISSSVLSEETINNYKTKVLSLRSQKERLEDERLGLNNSNDFGVEISEDNVELLRKFGIV